MKWVILHYCLYRASHNDQLCWWNGFPLLAWWAIVKCCICIFYDIGPHQTLTGASIHSVSPFSHPKRPESRRGESDIRPWARWCLVSWLNIEALRPWQCRSSYLRSSIVKKNYFFFLAQASFTFAAGVSGSQCCSLNQTPGQNGHTEWTCF